MYRQLHSSSDPALIFFASTVPFGSLSSSVLVKSAMVMESFHAARAIDTPTEEIMSQFLLLFRHPPVPSSELSPARFQELVVQMQAWHDQLSATATAVAIGKLKDGVGKSLRTEGGQLVIDGPYSETKEVLAGFFLIQTDSEEAAVEIAKGCPILAFGGRVDVRPLASI